MGSSIDPGTGALINQLSNPPNPMVKLGESVNALSAARQFQADQAVSDAYRQSIDPQTGQFDQGKFNALASQGAGAWKFGDTMRSSGAGFAAQGAGTSADVRAKLDQLHALGDLMYPLLKDATSGAVDPTAVQAQLEQAHGMGLINDQQYQAWSGRLQGMSPKDAAGFVIGANMGNQQAISMVQGSPSYTNLGGSVQYTNPGAFAARPYAPSTMTPTLAPGETAQLNLTLMSPVKEGWRMPDGSYHTGTLGQAMHDYGINPANVYVNPAAGTINARSAAPAAGASSPPPAAPGAAVPAPSAAPAAPQGGGGSQTAPAPAAPPVPVPQPRPATGGPTTQGGGRSSMPPSTVQAGEDSYNAAGAEQPNRQQRITTANLALQSLSSATVGGKGTEALQALNNALGTWSPDFIRKIIPDYDPAKAAADYQTAAKYMQQITNASIPGGQGTNEKLAAASTATPNVHMQDMAAKEVLQTMIAGERMGTYVFDQFQKTGLPPAQYAKWSADWARTHDPRAFMLGHMTPDQIKYLQTSIKPGSNEAKAFNNTVHELVTNGTIPDPTKPPGTD